MEGDLWFVIRGSSKKHGNYTTQRQKQTFFFEFPLRSLCPLRLKFLPQGTQRKNVRLLTVYLFVPHFVFNAKTAKTEKLAKGF